MTADPGKRFNFIMRKILVPVVKTDTTSKPVKRETKIKASVP